MKKKASCTTRQGCQAIREAVAQGRGLLNRGSGFISGKSGFFSSRFLLLLY